MLELTNAEESIMNCIWDLGEDVSVADLMKNLEERYKKIYARTTISVFMSFLRDKGYVTYHKKSHAYLYHPIISREAYRRYKVKDLMERCFDGSLLEFEKTVLEISKPEKNELKEILTLLQEN